MQAHGHHATPKGLEDGVLPAYNLNRGQRCPQRWSGKTIRPFPNGKNSSCSTGELRPITDRARSKAGRGRRPCWRRPTRSRPSRKCGEQKKAAREQALAAASELAIEAEDDGEEDEDDAEDGDEE